jgi:hypothetical protein
MCKKICDEGNSLIFPLPTFFLPGKESESNLNILYGSCHKLHGNENDYLVLGDNLLCSSITDLSKKPSSLFLTGDQIYADDVAGPIIKYLDIFAVKLLGWEKVYMALVKKYMK